MTTITIEVDALGRASAARIYEANRAARTRGILSVWKVYNRPKDYPDSFVARRFETGNGKPDAVATADMVTGDLAMIRESMEMCGLYCRPRAPSDDPVIVESWI
jgi:hypothetical protein